MLDSGQLSGKHTQVSGVLYRGPTGVSVSPCLRCVMSNATSAVVQTLHERPQRLLVEDGALCVSLT